MEASPRDHRKCRELPQRLIYDERNERTRIADPPLLKSKRQPPVKNQFCRMRMEKAQDYKRDGGKSQQIKAIYFLLPNL
jgi:hypothetical protein